MRQRISALVFAPFRTAEGKAVPVGIWLLGIVIVLAGVLRLKDKASNSEADSEGEELSDISSGGAAGGTPEITDLWSSPIKEQLSHLAKGIAKSDEEEVSMVLADCIGIVDPRELGKEELYRGKSLTVTGRNAPREESASLIEVEEGDFIKLIRELLFLDIDAPEDAIKLKLFGISRDGVHLRTKQRLTAKGKRDGNDFRSSAVVDATWITVSNDDLPKLKEFTLSNLIQSELTSEPSSVFEDVAGAVLGGNASWGQLRLGMNTWGRHIEHSLNPDFLGYHGVAIGDVDGDGLEDLYLCQPGGLPNLLFRQQADGTLLDISADSGVDWLDNSTGALLVDLDNDGDADLAVATQSSFLVMENDGEGLFSVRSQFSELGPGFSPTAADVDLDGDLDLLVLRYAASGAEIGDFPTPHPFHDARNGGANVLLRNDGNFKFADVTKESGLGENNHRFSFAASWEDFNNDGNLDLYVANDFGPNQLFRNDGTRFVDVSLESGSQDWGFGMSATWGDYDRDGLMDLYVSSMFSSAGNQIVAQAGFNPTMREETRKKFLKMVRGNSLLRNTKGERFSDVTKPMNEGFGGWAWGSSFADLNNDGWEDLYVANGYISQPDKDDL